MNIEESVRVALRSLIPCPKYKDCVTGRNMSKDRCSDTCSIYGCSVAQEHSALYQILQKADINGNIAARRQVISVMRKEISSGNIGYK